MLITALWLMVAPAQDGEPAQLHYQRAYRTSKTEATLLKCLIEELSDLGEQTVIRDQSSTILMIRNGQAPPVLIQIELPKVTITTREPVGTRTRIEGCVEDH